MSVRSTSIRGGSAAPAAPPNTTITLASGDSAMGTGKYLRSSDETRYEDNIGVEHIQRIPKEVNNNGTAVLFLRNARMAEAIKRNKQKDKGLKK